MAWDCVVATALNPCDLGPLAAEQGENYIFRLFLGESLLVLCSASEPRNEHCN